MATLTVWTFDSAGGAENALALLERMQKQELLQINDGAYVYWPEGKKNSTGRSITTRLPSSTPSTGMKETSR